MVVWRGVNLVINIEMRSIVAHLLSPSPVISTPLFSGLNINFVQRVLSNGFPW